MWRLLALCALLATVGAESKRETTIRNSDGDIFSGSLPDDEDLINPGSEDSEEPQDREDYSSGSGDGDISSEEDNSSVVSEGFPIDNRIPDDGPKQIPKESIDDQLVLNNEVVGVRSNPLGSDDSNAIPMAITGPENFFQRTEVIIALIAGGVVGLLFAVFLLLLLYFRMKKPGESTYDLGKKPIYKKAPTNENYA